MSVEEEGGEELFDNRNIGQEALENIINMEDVKNSIQVSVYAQYNKISIKL